MIRRIMLKAVILIIMRDSRQSGIRRMVQVWADFEAGLSKWPRSTEATGQITGSMTKHPFLNINDLRIVSICRLQYCTVWQSEARIEKRPRS